MLYLIRHGETSANQAGLYAGLAEYELTSNGQAQAKNIGDFVTSQLLNGLCIDEIIISSPSNRARITAKIIANYFNGTRVVIDDRINEVDYGKLDGTPIRKGISFIDEAALNDMENDNYIKFQEDRANMIIKSIMHKVS